MKKLMAFICLLLMACTLQAQNLVFNPSFEDSVANPDWGSDVSNMEGWFATYNSPDLFSPYCFSPMAQVPANFAGYQQAYDGMSYIGLATFSSAPPNYRELVETELLTDLVIGQKYFFSMYISRSDSCSAPPGIGPGSNNIGARFSVMSHYMGSPPPINNMAHIYSDSICYNMTNWNCISGSFIADSAYRYLTLGNLFDDSNTDTADGVMGFNDYAYYFIDMVCVSTDSMECAPNPGKPTGLTEDTSTDEVMVYPNPFTELIHIKLKTPRPFEIIIYDNNLKQIVRKSLDGEGIISLSEYSSGIYFYEIRCDHEISKFGKIIKR